MKLSIAPIWRAIRKMVSRAKRNHWIICAERERQLAREAHKNAAHFEKLAAIEASKFRSL